MKIVKERKRGRTNVYRILGVTYRIAFTGIFIWCKADTKVDKELKGVS